MAPRVPYTNNRVLVTVDTKNGGTDRSTIDTKYGGIYPKEAQRFVQ